MNIRDFFNDEQRLAIQDSIAAAERRCSGEIRVHLSAKCKGAALAEAQKVFTRLKMHKTAERNAVLIYIAPADKKLAILGDKGINERVPEGFWDQAFDVMRSAFADGRHAEGLQAAIHMAGEQLQHFFPYAESDRNELNNDISYGE